MVLAALGAGYRHIDSAQLYNNEAELGQAIRKSSVAREDVFLTTKIRYPGVNKAKTWKKVLDSVKKVSGVEVATTGRKRKRADDGAPGEEEQADGGAEYVDLFLVHTPYGPERQEGAQGDVACARGGFRGGQGPGDRHQQLQGRAP